MPILTVSQLNRQVRSWLEQEMGALSVKGELSNVSRPASGHLYFTLKDAGAQLRCVYFRNRHFGANNTGLENGQQVVLYGTLSLYETRGDYQLIVERLEETGQGDLYQQFEQLKIKLAQTGLFDAARKKELPKYPHVIGVITSASGAAIRDILSTLARRFPVALVLIFPCEVQGNLAAKQLIQAINLANHEKRCDVLILARGGGSIEDLWAFNDEQLAYAIANSALPIVSGVGHETDITIADFVADFRAETPTAAAVAVTPNQCDLIKTLQVIEMRLSASILRLIRHQQLLLNHHRQKLTSPRFFIHTQWQTLDYLSHHLQHAMRQSLTQNKHLLVTMLSRLEAHHPARLLQQKKELLDQLKAQLMFHINMKINHLKQPFSMLMATLHAVSPLATLDRGYALATYHNHVIMDSEHVHIDDIIDLRLAKGRIQTKVIRINHA
jgi:exodeoxyribonuclease VII large subunit